MERPDLRLDSSIGREKSEEIRALSTEVGQAASRQTHVFEFGLQLDAS
ncbi:hypothetical protein [Herbaspirillum sp. ST 5-3]|nr:hypothetical protein [Herbaspirillum sp. ST 5-3]